VATLETVLEVENVWKYYVRGKERVAALRGISLKIRRGEMFCVVGPNGAGKTTLIESVLGLRTIQSGSITLFGEKVDGKLPGSLTQRIGFVLEGMKLNSHLTVLENLELTQLLWSGRSDRREVLNSLDKFGLYELRNRLYNDLSAGQKRRVLILSAILHNPEFLILDEPEAGLDPNARLQVMDFIKNLSRSQGMTVLFSTHVMSIASKYSDRLAIINKGRIAVTGTPYDLIARYGGRWRVIIKVKGDITLRGFRKVEERTFEAEFPNPNDALDVVRNIDKSHIDELYLESPTLDDVYRRIVGGDGS